MILIQTMIFMSMMTIIIMSIFNSTLNSLNFIIMMILYSILTLLCNYMLFKLSIYNMMIMITIIGSMMIMFLYFTSLINTQKKNKLSWIFILMNFTMNFSFNLYFYFKNNNIIMNNEFNKYYFNIHNILIFPMNPMFILLTIYLFYIMIMVMKMSSQFKSPLRKIEN